MPTLNTQTFGQIVRGYAAAVQSAASQAITFVTGSVALALAEAVASVAQWLQGLIVLLLSATRLSTSQGSDVDSFVGDFGLTRLPAVAAQGPLTLSRFTPTQAAFVPVSAVAQTASGIQFAVIADTTQTAYNATLGGYQIPAGTASITATVQALVAGSTGNVQANTITTLTSPIAGVDTVTNAAPFTDGVDIETDQALKARFQLYIQSRQQGILAAVESAIVDLQQGIQYVVMENENSAGAVQLGNFHIHLWPGTSTILSDVYAAVDAVRPLTSTFSLDAVTALAVNAVMTVSALPGYALANVESAVQTAVSDFMGSLPIAAPLYYTQVYAVAYGVPGVQEATGLTLNGATMDIMPAMNQIIQPGTVTVN